MKVGSGINKPVTQIIGSILAILFISLGLELMIDPFKDAVTKPYTQTGSVASNSDGNGSMVLGKKHFFTDATDLTAIGATDGDLTNAATIGADRKSLTFTGLTASTSQSITVNSLQNRGSTIDALWKALPFFFLIGVVAAVIGAAGAATGVSGDLSQRILTGVLVIVIGAILAGVQIGFVDSAMATYAKAPEFTGIDLGLPLLNLAYVLVLLTLAFGMFSGTSATSRVRKAISGKGSGGM